VVEELASSRVYNKIKEGKASCTKIKPGIIVQTNSNKCPCIKFLLVKVLYVILIIEINTVIIINNKIIFAKS